MPHVVLWRLSFVRLPSDLKVQCCEQARIVLLVQAVVFCWAYFHLNATPYLPLLTVWYPGR